MNKTLCYDCCNKFSEKECEDCGSSFYFKTSDYYNDNDSPSFCNDCTGRHYHERFRQEERYNHGHRGKR